MTNALAQNIEQNQNSNAIDLMMQVVNSSNQTKTQEKNEFSNIINNLESKTQKTQSDFEKQAKVTNVSSINKKALDKNEKEPIATKNVEKNIQNIKNISKEIEQTSKKQTKEINTTQNKNIIKEENKNFETTNNITVSKKIETKTIKESENLSDINNSSPVESSPVFSSGEEIALNEELKTQIESTLEEIDLNIEQIINSLPVVSNDIKLEIKDLNGALENVENLEDLNEISNKIEYISSNLDNSTLNQEQKTEITNSLNEIKNLLKDLKEVTEQPTEFKNLMVELEEKISDLIETKEIETDTNLKIEVKNKDIQFNQEINSESLKEVANEIKEITNDVNNAISNLDNKKINELNKKLTESLEKLNSIDETKNTDLAETLKNLKNLLDEVTTPKNEIKQEITQLDLNNANKIFETLDKLSSNEFKNIDPKDEKVTKEIVKLLNNLDNEIQNQELNNELKIEIEKLIQKANDKTISADELTQAIDVLADDIKIESEKIQNINLEAENTINPSKEILKAQTNLNQNLNQEQNQKNPDLETKEIEIDLDQFNEADFDLNETKLEASATKVDVKNVEQNLQKTIAINEMLDEMMVEVDIKTIPSQSGALSVTDEITKLAMGESNSLNSINTTSGSVTYDSVGTNVVIKNIANLTKPAQIQNQNTPSMEDVLNQVANKVTQLKDVNAQKLTMVLRPNDLGRLQIELTSNQQGLTTQIMAQNEDVRAYIEKNIDSLRQQLSDAGVNVNSIQIKTAGSEGSTTYDGNQNLNKDFEQENQNQQNSNDGKNHKQNNDNKDAKEILATISNYDMSFAKDFSSILNKSLSYGN